MSDRFQIWPKKLPKLFEGHPRLPFSNGLHLKVKDTEEEGKRSTEEQYPPAEDRYKQLEDRLNAMEIQQVSGLDFGDLGLSSGVIIPHKFKAPSFTKYDGASCPKLHLRSYVRKIQPYTVDKNLWIHFFQESLSGTHLEWFYQLDGTKV